MDHRTRKIFENRRGQIEFIFERAAEQRYPFNDGAALARELRLLNLVLFNEDKRLVARQLTMWNSWSIEQLDADIELAGDFISEHHMEIDSEPEFGCKACACANRDIRKMTEIRNSKIAPITKCWCGRELRWFPSCGSMCSESHDPLHPGKGHDMADDIPF